MENVAEETLALFPFICGLCLEQFDNVHKYYLHFNTHGDHVRRFFHLCEIQHSDESDPEHSHSPSRNEKILSNNVDTYACGNCSFISPSLCYLHRHLQVVECVNNYEVDSRSKIAHFKQYTASKIKHNSMQEETETFEVNEDVKTDLYHSQANNLNTCVSNTESVHKVIPKDKNNSHKLNQQEKEHETLDSLINYTLKPIMHRRLSNVSSKKKRQRDQILDYKFENHNSLIHQSPEKVNVNTKLESRTKRKTKKCTKIHSPLKINSDALKEQGHEKSFNGSTSTKTSGTNDDILACDKCGLLVKRAKLKMHMICHTETRDFPCDLCSYQSKTTFALKQHVRMVHTVENNFTCPTCGKSFKNNLYLRQHIETHSERDKPCTICGKVFITTPAMKRHMLVHNDEKRYSCSMCDRQFTFKGNLNAHIHTVHSTSRDFHCTVCDKTFKIQHALKKHVKTHEPHQHFCQICGKTFVTSYNLKIHGKTHYK